MIEFITAFDEICCIDFDGKLYLAQEGIFKLYIYENVIIDSF
jgi:hypothetical protein